MQANGTVSNGMYDISFGENVQRSIPMPQTMFFELAPLARAEYLLPLSILLGKESLAQSLFQNTVTGYQCNQNAYKDVADGTRPRVAWIMSVNGNVTKQDPFFHETLVHDAGGVQIAEPTAQTIRDPIAIFEKTDFVIDDSTTVQTMADFLAQYWVANQGTSPGVSRIRGKVYKADRLTNMKGAWGELFFVCQG